MGDSSNMPTQPSSDTLAVLFDGCKDHFGGKRVSTELILLEIIRKAHPENLVTRVSPSKLDFQGYAHDGHAEITLECDDKIKASTRRYTPRGSRMDSTPGRLSDEYEFARWLYEWKGFQFIMYEITYPGEWKPPTKLWFVLSDREQETTSKSAAEGHSATEELLLAVGAWSSDLHNEIYVFDNSQWHKSQELWTSVKGASWADVVLEPIMKDNLINDVQSFFDNQALYRKLAVPWKRGLILHGVPGNGKTISIKALINSLYERAEPVPSLYVKSFDNQCQGEKFSIQSIFGKARNMAPCLLIFEDLDSLVTDENRSYFLNEVDGLESNDGILMIGSTNHLDSLDPAIAKRPSRFDRKYHFKLPSENERSAYCRFWKGKLENSDLVDFDEELCGVIAKLTEGFSFAYLKELFVVALLVVARGGTGNDSEEIADLDEEDSRKPAKEKTVQTPIEEAKSEDGNTTDDVPVVVEHTDAKKESAEEVEAATMEIKDEVAPVHKQKRTLPQVEVPDSVKDNVLLRVISKQVMTLLEEMDNTKEDDWASSRKQAGGVPGGISRQTRRLVRAR